MTPFFLRKMSLTIILRIYKFMRESLLLTTFDKLFFYLKQKIKTISFNWQCLLWCYRYRGGLFVILCFVYECPLVFREKWRKIIFGSLVPPLYKYRVQELIIRKKKSKNHGRII